MLRRLLTYLAIPLVLSTNIYAQFGRGSSGASISSLLPIIADSTLLHKQGTTPDTVVVDGALPVKFSGMRVTGDTQLDGNLTMNTVASESLKVLAGGIRNEGGLIQKGNSSFGLQQTPKSTVQVTGNGISSVNYYKGLRLSNPDAATVGVQAVSPALVFRGAGWKTNATAGSDSVLWGMYVLPEQGTASPVSYIYFNSKTGTESWVNRMYLSSAGGLRIAGVMTADRFASTSANTYLACAGGTNIVADADNSGSDGVIAFGRGSYTALSTEYARFTHAGNFGIGTTAPAALLHANNANVLSKPLFRLGRDKNATPDSLAMSVTGSGKVSIAPTPADTTAKVTIKPLGIMNPLLVKTAGDTTALSVSTKAVVTIAKLTIGSSNFTTTKMDTVFTAGYVPRWVKFTSGAKTWYSPVYADTTGKW